MTTPVAPQVDCEKHHASLPVSDTLAATEFYTKKLGFRLGFTWGDPPELAGVNLGDVQVFLRQECPSPQGCVVYFVIGDADELYAFHLANGVDVTQPPADQPHGLREYVVRDPYGNFLVFGHYIYNVGPSIAIERVPVPLRLEKRLAALLEDLAKHKRMSLDSCVEEALLHTFEPVGEGVASPHTPRTLRHIQELKVKHRIDYDSHGSYRFVEP